MQTPDSYKESAERPKIVMDLNLTDDDIPVLFNKIDLAYFPMCLPHN